MLYMISLSVCLSEQVVGENRYIVGKFMLIYIIIWNDVFLSLMVNRSKYCRISSKNLVRCNFIVLRIFFSFFFLSFLFFFFLFFLQANVKDTYISIGFSPSRAVEVRSAQENTAVVCVHYSSQLHLLSFFLFLTKSYVDFYSQLCLD